MASPLSRPPLANGISGITAPRQMFLACVFLDDSVPAGAAPASLDFTGNTGFASPGSGSGPAALRYRPSRCQIVLVNPAWFSE
jgi:hypothetical protein